MPKSFDLSVVLGIDTLPEYLKEVEQCISDTLGEERTLLGKAVLRLTDAKGKRLRPTLVIAAALLTGEISKAVIKAAAAVELIHIGSLVHDDIIDKADTRWGIPTINEREGPDYAILGGDYLFAKACQLAAEVNAEAGILAAQTIADLCSGQSEELATQHDITRSEAALERAAFGKTAALTAAACKLGAICSEQTSQQIEALGHFGSDFGMGFQLIDDVLDFVSTDKLMGKPVGNDIKEGVYALPLILSLNGPDRTVVKQMLSKNTASSKELVTKLMVNGSIESAITKAETYNQSAQKALSIYGTKASQLAQLPALYLDWALANLVSPEFASQLTRRA